MRSGRRTRVAFFVFSLASALVFVLFSCSSSTSPTPPSPTTGSIQVHSTPTGAKVYLDGADTGRTTNTTLSSVAPGSRTVKLVRDGYVDHTSSVNVTAGQTATVNAMLDKNTITVTAPAAGAVLWNDVTYDIQWQVSTTMPAPTQALTTGRSEEGFGGRLRSPVDRRSGARADFGIRDFGTETQAPATALRPGDRRLATRPGSALGADAVVPDTATSALPGTIVFQKGRVVTPQSDLRTLDIADVRIELWKGGSKEFDIVASTPNDGTHPWLVPASLAAGTDYKIRIVCATDDSVYGDSADFTVRGPELYVFDLKWGSFGSGDGQFQYPVKIAVDGSGHVYVSDFNNYRVQKFTSTGGFVTKWGSRGSGDGQFDSPMGIAVDGSNHVYVADYSNHRIQKFTSDGTFVTKWGSQGTGDGQFSFPHGIAIDSAGYVYVLEFMGARVQKFTSDGMFVTKWGSQGSGDGQFFHPIGIAVDGSGHVFVGDNQNHRVQKFASDGMFVTKWGSQGTEDGQFNNPYGVATDGSGDVYVVDYFNHRIQKFASDGTFVTKWGTQGTGDGQFTHPYDIDVDGFGYVYVVDYLNNRIQKFRKAG